MAKQAGLFLITGTIDNLTFYEMNGKHYVKRKTEVSRKRIRTNPQYSNTMRNANWFGQAVKLAREVYYQLPRNERDQYKTWYPMRNRAQELVRKELAPDEIIRLLREEYLVPVIEKQNGVKELPKVQVPDPQLLVAQLPVYGKVYEVADSALMDQLVAAVGFVRSVMREKDRKWEGRSVRDKNAT